MFTLNLLPLGILKVWLNEKIPFDLVSSKVKKEVFQVQREIVKNNFESIALELSLPIGGMIRHGALGIKFNSDYDDTLTVEIQEESSELYQSSLVEKHDQVYKGIAPEFIPSIFEEIKGEIRDWKFGGKVLRISGACGKVGSSIIIFRSLIGLIMNILSRNNANLSEEEIKELWSSSKFYK